MRGTMMDFPLTMHHVFERGTRLFPEQEIVTGGGAGVAHRYTYRDFDQRTRQVASGLLDLGLRRGDRVATFGWNHYRHLELYFGVPLIGSVLHTLNIRLFQDQLSYIINHAEDRYLVVDRSLLPTLSDLLPSLRTVERLIVVDDGDDAEVPDQSIDYEAVVDRGDPGFTFPTVDETEAAMMCYTSGTTGNPKGVAYTHRSLTLHSFGVCVSDALGISMRDTTMAVVPMFHANAWGIPYGSTFVGAKQVLPGAAPSPERLLNLLQDEQVTMAAGVPTIWIGLLPAVQSGKYDLSRLDRLIVGGSAAPRGLIEAYHKAGLNILHAWGMTEMSPIGTVSRLKPALTRTAPERQLDYEAKQGLSVPGVEARAIDPDGNEVPRGEQMGELVVRGPWVTATYYNDEERSGASFTADGWFRTGDVVTIDDQGYIEIADRTKDLIRSGGEWISSVALENALMAHPKVLEAAVIAVPDERWAERPLACVVPRPEARGALSDAELTDHLARQFAKWWLPDHFLILDELPKTSVGKFDKKALRQAHAAPHPIESKSN
jgi:acyl-CoA synthetase (AMP-forming)/AMP-acid ligase II